MLRRLVGAILIAALPAVGCSPADIGREQRVRLPAGMPADVPLPERAVLRATRGMGESGQNLVFETDDTVERALGGLRASLATMGWTLVSEASVGNAVFASYRKAGRLVALGVGEAEGVTVVGLAYQPQASSGAGGGG